MQSHASRHVASEFLKDLHPDLAPPFLKEIVKDEISVAHGRRGIQKLIDVLALEPSELTDEQRAHALRVFCALLSTQEHKTDAIAAGASQPVTRLVIESKNDEVRRLSCECLASLAQVRSGRDALVQAGSVSALTQALVTTPTAATNALRTFSTGSDGVSYLSEVHDTLVPALVTVVQSEQDQQGVTLLACQHAADTLAAIASNDQGIEACLKHGVPAAVVQLLQRCLTGSARMEEGMPSCAEACASCIEQIAHHADGKTALREASAIEQLGVMLQYCAYHQGCMRKATSALMGISVEKESKVPIITSSGKTLVNLLKSHHDGRLVSSARAALISCCEHLDARRVVQSLLTEEDMTGVLYQGPLPDTPPDFRYQVICPSNAT